MTRSPKELNQWRELKRSDAVKDTREGECIEELQEVNSDYKECPARVIKYLIDNLSKAWAVVFAVQKTEKGGLNEHQP